MRDRKIRILIFFLILFMIQIYLLDFFRIFSVKFDLLIPALVNLALNYNLGYVLGFSLFLGFLQDILGNFLWGINSFLFFLTGYLVYRLSGKLIIESLFLKITIMAMTFIVINTLKGLFFYLFVPGYPISIFFKMNFLSLFYTLLLSFLVIKAMDSICQQERYL